MALIAPLQVLMLPVALAEGTHVSSQLEHCWVVQILLVTIRSPAWSLHPGVAVTGRPDSCTSMRQAKVITIRALAESAAASAAVYLGQQQAEVAHAGLLVHMRLAS